MSTPKWVGHHKDLWEKPWTVELDPSKHAEYKQRLWDHGFLSPHFTRKSAASADGVQLPEKYRHNGQRHAFALERVRHRLERPLSPLDWYRSPAHNANVGGASNSEHLYADATDWGGQTEQIRFNKVMHDVFSHGGIGSGAVSGNVQHVGDGDVNGGPRRWTYAGR